MQGLAPPAVVEAPVATPPLHSLVASALDPRDTDDNRWEHGYAFQPRDCFVPNVWSPHCPDGANQYPGGGVDKSAAPEQPDEVVTLPVIVEVPIECHTRGLDDREFRQRALQAVEAATPNALENEFWTGALIPDNASLVNTTPATVVTPGPTSTKGVLSSGSMTPARALARLNQGLARAGVGSRGMIHATPELVTLWAGAGLLTEDGPRLIDKVRGNVIVAGGGYPGTGPNGHASATPPADKVWAYATGMVQVRLGQPEVVPDNLAEALDRKTNLVLFRGERSASAAWSTCVSLAVLVDLVGVGDPVIV